MHVKLQACPRNTRERADFMGEVGTALARWNARTMNGLPGKPPCCSWCAGVGLTESPAVKDSHAMLRSGKAGPLSIAAYSCALLILKGHDACVVYMNNGNGFQPYVADLTTGETKNPLEHYETQTCDCPDHAK